MSLDSFASEKLVFLLMPWKLGFDHMLTMMCKMPTSMRLDYLHRSTMTNTLAWNLTLFEQPQHDNPRLTLPGDRKHSSLDPGRKRISEWDESLSGCGGLTVTRGMSSDRSFGVVWSSKRHVRPAPSASRISPLSHQAHHRSKLFVCFALS